MHKPNQKGAALIIFAVIFALAATAFLISGLDGKALRKEREKSTAFVLAEAKTALIGYALKSGSSVGAGRPGDLPCPDNYPLRHANSGTSGSALTTTCNGNAIGRLPWRTLGIRDLRDEHDERLWYAVSTNYKNNPRIGKLNSESNGTITIRDSTGTIIRNGTTAAAAIAVVIAPGNSLTRQDGVVQNHIEANYNNPLHYLDNFDSLDNSKDEDNSNFVENSANGFIGGLINEANNSVVLNDQALTINYGDLMPLLEKRVANEVKKRLTNLGGLPLAVPFSNPSTLGNNFASVKATNQGFLPAYPHYWFSVDSNSSYITYSGNVNFSDVKSGFIEPGFCEQNGLQIVCSGRKKMMLGATAFWRNVSISINGMLNVSNSLPNSNMIGSLTINDVRIPDGMIIGTGAITPTPTTEISILPTISTNFPVWLTANDWHHEVYYAVANPFVYSAPYPPVCGSCLSVNYNGSVLTNVGAITLVAGRKLDSTLYQPITPQNRPSANLYDYYDTFNNQSGGVIYDWNRVLSKNFNDQSVVITQ